LNSRAWAQAAAFEEFAGFGILFVHAEDFYGLPYCEFRKRHRAPGVTQPRQTAAQRQSVWARTIGAEALQQKRFDLGREAVFEALGCVVPRVQCRPITSVRSFSAS